MTSLFRPLTSIRTLPSFRWVPGLTPILRRHRALAKPSPGGCDAARVTAATLEAPASRRASAQAARVAPVVITSSTRSARSGAGETGRTRGGSASRSARRRPTCRGLCDRPRHGTSGSAVRLASAAAIASAESNPRWRRRSGAGGTGTIVPSRSSPGRRPAMRDAASSASPSREPNLSAPIR